MKGIIGTIVSGAIGLAALYVVGRIAYQAGHDIAEAECRYEQLKKSIEKKEAADTDGDRQETDAEQSESEEEVPEKKRGIFSTIRDIRKLLSKKNGNVIGNLVRDPESHVFEACIKGREIHVNVKPKTA